MLSLFLSPKYAPIPAFLLLMGVLIPLFHPAFHTDGSEPALNGPPLQMERPAHTLKARMGYQTLADMQDTWGFAYPPSGQVDIDDRDFRHEARALNQAIQELENNQIQRASRFLSRYFNEYRPKVNGSGSHDPNPRGETKMVLYALYRYHRALVGFELAANLNPGHGDQKELLRNALYDLRRAVGTFERLGRSGLLRRAYWGPDTSAWEGAQLLAEHGNLPIHHAYTNLAVAYLRLDDRKGYPQIEPSYMNDLTRNVYGQSGTRFNSLVADLVQDLSRKGRRADLKTYRLTLALQNMEAASRGMSRHNDKVLFSYTSGLLLNQLQRLDEDVSLADAVDAFSRALTAPIPTGGSDHEKALHDRVKRAAAKELSLLYLILEDEERFVQTLAAMTPGAIRDTITGPDPSKGLLFTDIEQYSNYAGLHLDRVAAHLSVRQNEYQTGRLDQSTLAAHETITRTMADLTFAALRRRLVQWLDEGRVSEVAAALQKLDADPALQSQSILSQAYQEQCRKPLQNVAAIGLNLSLRSSSSAHRFAAMLPKICLVLLLLHGIGFYLAHRAMAKRVLKSGYRADAGF